MLMRLTVARLRRAGSPSRRDPISAAHRRDEESSRFSRDTVPRPKKNGAPRALASRFGPESCRTATSLGLASHCGRAHLEAQALQLLRHFGGIVGRLLNGERSHRLSCRPTTARRLLPGRRRCSPGARPQPTHRTTRIACRRMKDSLFPFALRHLTDRRSVNACSYIDASQSAPSVHASTQPPGFGGPDRYLTCKSLHPHRSFDPAKHHAARTFSKKNAAS